MEITNNSLNFSIPLVVGRRIAQIIFFETEGTEDGSSYEQKGKYMGSADMAQLQRDWNPGMMLPKCYLDREALEASNKINRML